MTREFIENSRRSFARRAWRSGHETMSDGRWMGQLPLMTVSCSLLPGAPEASGHLDSTEAGHHGKVNQAVFQAGASRLAP